MLLDGYHNRKRYGSIKQTAERSFRSNQTSAHITGKNNSNSSSSSSSSSNNVIAELTATIQQDVKSCLSRMVAGITHQTTKETRGPNLWLASDERFSEGGQAAHKSALEKVLGDQFFKGCSQGLHERTKSFKQHQQRLIPASVKSGLSRSYSVQQRKIDANQLRTRYQMSTENSNSIDRIRTRSKPINKTSSNPWSLGINKFSVTSVLPIIAYLTLIALPTCVENASLPPPQLYQEHYGVRPIWLTEGLINLDTENVPSPLEDGPLDDSSLRQSLLDILNSQPEQQQQHESRLKPSWSPYGREVLTDQLSQTDREDPSLEQLLVQRRRLDRNRALEPPPWMREQPMRRGYNPRFLPSEEDNLETFTENLEDVDLVATDHQDNTDAGQTTTIPGRKSRQSSDEVYDEVLRYLIEGAFQGQDFLTEIHDELERRTKSGSQSGLIFSGDGMSQQLQQLQQKITNQPKGKMSSALQREDLLREQDIDPDAGLVVVGDEVSTGDGPTSAIDPTMQATHADMQAPQGQGSLDFEPQQPTSFFKYGPEQRQFQTNNNQPDGLPIRFENSPYTFENPSAETSEQSLKQSRYSTVSGQEPFHVLEEIDQIDETQSMPQQISNDGAGDSTASQSAQLLDELLNIRGARSIGSDNSHSSRFRPAVRDLVPSSSIDGGDGDFVVNPPAPKWPSPLARTTTLSTQRSPLFREGSKVGIALRMIESGYLNKGQLVQMAAKLKSHLEDMTGLRRGSILDLYPINPQQLLVKLDTTKLSAVQIMDMIQNYDFARGFIVLSWHRGSQNNPMPILVAVLNELANRNNPVDPSQQQQDDPLAANTDMSKSFDGQLSASALNLGDDEKQANRPRLSLATLTALLGAIYAKQDVELLSGVEQLPTVAEQQALTSSEGKHQPLMDNPRLIQVSAIVLALVGAFVAVKLAMRGQDNRMLLRRNLSRSSRSLRSFWSFGGSQDDYDPQTDQGPDGEVRTSDGKVTAGADSIEQKCTAGNLATNRHLAAETDSIVTANGEERHKRNLEQLSRRLVSILSGFSHHRREDSDEKKSTDLEGGSSDKSDSGLSEDDPQHQTPYKSSRSYIKALIDVLSKARPFSTSALCEQDPDETSKLTTSDESSEPQSQQQRLTCEQRSDSSDESQLDHDVLLSQMDITAAHLILSYMESHLEDKERLRREWLQLNGGGYSNTATATTTRAKVSSSSSSKAGCEPNLQRLAKVALSEENRNKNRDPNFVAYDRNRVRLNPSANREPRASGGKLRQRNQQQQQQPSASDYINASFVYDDDPSRPTHIIAQGPLEQTVSQFWQMIWEQGISVIVMLTRLNENSNRQCHCYWPTGSKSTPRPCNAASGGANQSPADSSGNVSPPIVVSQSPLLDDAHALATNGSDGKQQQQQQQPSNETATSAARRGSVTSVFSMTSSTSAAATVSAGAVSAAGRSNGQVGGRAGCNGSNGSGAAVGQKGQPLIGNKDLLSSVISFDVCLTIQASASAAAGTSVAEREQLSSTNSELELELEREDCFDQQQTSKGAKTTGRQAKNNATRTTTKVVRFEVHLVSEHVSSNDYLVRNMCLINRSTGETRTITQFHYLSWPDSGVPENVKNLLSFRRKVHKSYRNLKSPILVHCSDGAGRSGTYTLIDIILERIRNGAREIDPIATLVHLREQRAGLCANLGQFEFVLMALAEEIQIILDALPQ